MCLAQTAHCQNFGLSVFGSGGLCHQGNLAVIVTKAHLQKPVVRDSVVKRKMMKIPLVDAAVRKVGVEADNQVFIFRSNGANDHLGSILKAPRFNILERSEEHTSELQSRPHLV